MLKRSEAHEDEDTVGHESHLVGWLVPVEHEAAVQVRTLRRRLRPWRYAVLVALLLAAVGWFSGSRLLYGPLVAAQPAVRADFVQTVVASGHVEAPFRVNIASQITGVVADVPVSEGQSVKAGDVLIVLDDREARSAVIQAEGVVAQAEARLRQMRELTLPSAREQLKQSQATVVNAEQAYDRAKKLAESGSGTRVALDDATKVLDVARAQLRSAEFQVYTASPGGSDYVVAETQLRQAAAALSTVQSRLSYTVIKAPRDGVLISRNVEKGNVVQPSNVLMILSPFADTQIVVQVDEKNLGLIAVGQQALASADAFPKETFAAEVVYINPGIDLQRASVEVKLKVPAPPTYLRQDMTVSVDIETARRPSALILPSASLRGLSSGDPWVLILENGHAVRRPVKVGLTTIGKAEITDGLKEGDLVIDPLSPAVEGARVRPALPAARP